MKFNTFLGYLSQRKHNEMVIFCLHVTRNKKQQLTVLSRALLVHRVRKTNMRPRRENSFIYKNPENLYKRSVHVRKNRRRESDF